MFSKKNIKRAVSVVTLSALMTTTFLNVGVNKVFAKEPISVEKLSGSNETISLVLGDVTDAAITSVKYQAKGGNAISLEGEDFEYLVRDENGKVRIDIPGVKAGEYTVEVKTADSTVTTNPVTVEAYDRAGYAHFGYNEGVGAYNNDGTLKANAKVIYVTEENKNTVSITSKDGTTVTGIGNILNSNGQDSGNGKCAKGGTCNTNADIIRKLADDGTPLVVRIIGKVSNLADTTTPASTQLINGLTVYNSIDNGGSVGDNGGMARIKDGKDITIEGIGTNATMDGWGIHFMCTTNKPEYGKSFELRNIVFTNTPEDAVGMEGVQASNDVSSDLSASVERCWIHNNAFYAADFTEAAESDKKQGDGSCDFKRGQYLTVSYNYFQSCHKTNLVGGGDKNVQYNLTYHHNFWYMCESRGPLARNANIHMYNNYFFGQTSYCMNPRANSYIFSESNMFYMCKNPQNVTLGAVKSYNDSYSSVIYNSATPGTIVDSKDAYVANECKFTARNIDYSKFDTDAKLSYIPANNYILQDRRRPYS